MVGTPISRSGCQEVVLNTSRRTPAFRAASPRVAACSTPLSRSAKVGEVKKTASTPSQARATEAGSFRSAATTSNPSKADSRLRLMARTR